MRRASLPPPEVDEFISDEWLGKNIRQLQFGSKIDENNAIFTNLLFEEIISQSRMLRRGREVKIGLHHQLNHGLIVFVERHGSSRMAQFGEKNIGAGLVGRVELRLG